MLETYVQVMDCSHSQVVEAESEEEALQKAKEIGEWENWDCEESGAIALNEAERARDYTVEEFKEDE